MTAQATKAFRKQIGTNLNLRTWWQTRQLQKAVERTYAKFSQQHPVLVNSLLDAYFFQIVACPVLVRYMQTTALTSSVAELSQLWIKQFPEYSSVNKFISDVNLALAKFLTHLETELQ